MKRYTETEKWRDPWFQSLPINCKLLWMWMCDNCDSAGVLEPDWTTPSAQIGCPISAADLKLFERQIEVLENGKILILQFIPFQQGKLSRDCRGQIHVFKALEKHGLVERYEKNQWLKKTPFKEQQEAPLTAPEKPAGSAIEAFKRFWDAYPRKVSIYEAQHAFTEVHAQDHIEEILKALSWQVRLQDWTKENGRYILSPQRYLREGRWHDEPPPPPAANAPAAPTTPGAPGTTKQAPLWCQVRACEAEIERLFQIYEFDLCRGAYMVQESKAMNEKREALAKENKKKRRELQARIDELNQRIAQGEA